MASNKPAGKERRRDARMALPLPVKVQGHDPDGTPWEEMSTAEDLSASGAGFTLRHPVGLGRVVFISLPMPKRFRRYDITDASYRTYALVRWAVARPPGYKVGVLFLGKIPPRGHDKTPGGIFLLDSDADPTAAMRQDRRRAPRGDVFVNFKIRRVNPTSPGPTEELTIAEDLSTGGAKVMTSMAVDKGEVIELEETGGDFRCRAEVRAISIGANGIPRLHLMFLDAEAPARLLG